MWRKKICMDDSGRFSYKTNDRNFSLLSVYCGIFFAATKIAVVPRSWFCYGAMLLLCRWQKMLSKLESARLEERKEDEMSRPSSKTTSFHLFHKSIIMIANE